MTLDEAVRIVYGKERGKSYNEAIKIINQEAARNPDFRVKVQNKGIPLKNVLAAIGEAGKTGLDRNARMDEERAHRRRMIADRIRQVRQLNRMTQDEISAIIDWNALTYRGYENCKSDIPIVILIRLADYYGVSMDYLTGRTATQHETKEVGSELEQRIAKLENALLDRKKEAGD